MFLKELTIVLQVSLPSQMEQCGPSAPPTPGGTNSLLQSPLMHPALRRIAGVYGPTRSTITTTGAPNSPSAGPSAADRFSSPMPGSAKRRLFGANGEVTENIVGGTTPTATTSKVLQVAHTEDGRQVGYGRGHR